MVTEFIEGKELKKEMEENKLDVNEIKLVMESLSKGLKYLGDKNIIHRDIKPENIIINKEKMNEYTQEPFVKIIDFGLAEFNNKQKRVEHPRCGTEGYIAPEVFLNKGDFIEYDNKIDVYSLGVIFYKLMIDGDHFIDLDESNYSKVLNNQNKTDNFYFDEDEKEEIVKVYGMEALKLLKSMTCFQAEKRIHINDIIEHPFLKLSTLLESERSIKNRLILSNKSISPLRKKRMNLLFDEDLVINIGRKKIDNIDFDINSKKKYSLEDQILDENVKIKKSCFQRDEDYNFKLFEEFSEDKPKIYGSRSIKKKFF